ncbi:MAG: ArsR/SmtB family transcription factor [Weeksellaceae bacterium]
MGITKTAMYQDEIVTISSYFKVLGHPARITILQHLMNLETCVCGDLVESIGLSQSTISQHLKELKNIGLIQGTIEGSSVCYCINKKEWQKMNAMLGPFLALNNQTNTKCC